MSKIRVAGLVAMCALLVNSYVSYANRGSRMTASSTSSSSEMTWSKERKLTWDDFRGAIPHNAEEQTAAATYCGIGFETNSISSTNTNLKIRVYNTFYINNSWARPEEMNEDVLAHEQGHFDLCELYTRKLRERMSNLKVNANTMKPTLRKIYEELQVEYRARQEAYEDETSHGVNLPQQKRWQRLVDAELAETEQWRQDS
jgi:hypothetical protein